ncbi:MAG: DNA polymerase I [Candidatus Neomarinimicrobiota bacterium]|nr:MAG: DNA polymerase I [Candidatus Neomarinimicrobiota bacterium]
MSKPRLFLIDGSALAYRSHFAMIKNRLTTSKGFPTGATYAFINSLFKILNEESPEYIGIVFDAPEKTFRHELFEAYKATREAMPDELVEQLPVMFELVKSLGIPVIVKPGYEADDVIGTLALKASKMGLKVYMVTGDKDLMQLVNEDILMYKPGVGQKETEIIDVGEVIEKWGVRPEQIPDLLGLAGDSVDNIPGVKGIGPKRAASLINEFGSLEKIFENLDKVSNEKLRNLLKDGKESAFTSKELAVIRVDVPVELDLNELRLGGKDEKKLMELLEKLEFYSIIKSLKKDKKEEKKKNYKIVLSLEELKDVVEKVRKAELFSVDLETTSIRPMEAEIVGISLCIEPDSGYYIPVRYKGKSKNNFGDDDLKIVLEELKPVLEDDRIKKCGHNIKYDMLVFERNGINLRGVDIDTMVAAWIIQPDSHSYKLDNLSQQYLHYTMVPIEELIGKGKKNQITMDEVELNRVAFYAVEDADIALQLVPIFRAEMRATGTEEVFRKIEMPLIPVLMEMEKNGVYVDIDYLKEMSQEISKKIDVLADNIYKVAGVEFNINSPKQLSEVLFEKLGLPRVRGKSTDVKVLEKLRNQHELPALVLDYRSLVKLKTTYLDAMAQYVNSNTGRIHSSFNQTGASTGRITSSDPNFQNIPIRTDIGREIRKAFKPQKSGWKMMSADYSQIELRIMAHLSKDPELLKSFNEGVDVHTRTAALVYGVSEKDVLPEMRRVAKIVNFGIMYGAGPFRMSEELGIPQEEARKLIEQYFKTYPGINEYIIKTLQEAEKNKFVKTLSGRIRYVYDITSDNYHVREAAKRVAINTPIQGTAADMIKIAMINISRRMKEKSLRAMMILQIHDELLFEVPEEEIETLREVVVQEMENAIKLDVPVKVDVGIGNSWYEAH